MRSNASRVCSTVAAPSAVRRGAVLDDRDRVLRLGLDLADQPADLPGGGLRLLGQLADLLGDDREAAALLARAGGLDGRVERQQVRLLGDAGDRRDDPADLLGLGREIADRVADGLRRVAHGAHGLGGLAGGRDALASDLPRLLGDAGGLLGVRGGLADGRGDLLGRAARRLDHLHLALGALGDVADG